MDVNLKFKNERSREYVEDLLTDHKEMGTHEFYETHGLGGMLEIIKLIKVTDIEINKDFIKLFVEKTVISINLYKNIKNATKQNNKILKGISDIKIIFCITYLTIITLTIVALKR